MPQSCHLFQSAICAHTFLNQKRNASKPSSGISRRFILSYLADNPTVLGSWPSHVVQVPVVFSYPTCSSPPCLPLVPRFEHHLPVPRRLTSISEVGNSNRIRVYLNDAPRAPSPLAFADLSIPLTELGGSTFATSFHARRTLISPST